MPTWVLLGGKGEEEEEGEGKEMRPEFLFFFF
jgi:hypothetical protein